MMTVGELVNNLGAKVDGFNLLETVKYLRDSKLARKVRSSYFLDDDDGELINMVDEDYRIL